jgi:amino acid permease
MDLSPGTLSVPNNAPLGGKLPGLGCALCMMFCALRMMRVQVNDHSNF